MSGIIIIGICSTVIITFICTLITAVFQYLHRVHGNSGICAVFKYIITSFSIMYTLLKATYLFHFAYLMYRTYNRRSYKENDKKLLYIYSLFNVIVGVICTVLVIVIDLFHERTVFALYNGYCADFFREPGVSDQVLIALLAIITAVGIVFFIAALTFY